MRFFIFLAFALSMAGCQVVNSEAALQTSVTDYLARLQIAQQQAATHWDQLIIQGTADCSQGLPTLARLEIPAQELAASEALRALSEALNETVQGLNQSAELWDTLCLNPSQSVLPSDANQGYLFIQAAGQALVRAQALQSAWNP